MPSPEAFEFYCPVANQVCFTFDDTGARLSPPVCETGPLRHARETASGEIEDFALQCGRSLPPIVAMVMKIQRDTGAQVRIRPYDSLPPGHPARED